MELYNPVGKSEGMASCAAAEAYSFAKPVFLLTVLLHFNAGKTQLKFEIVFVFFFFIIILLGIRRKQMFFDTFSEILFTP